MNYLDYFLHTILPTAAAAIPVIGILWKIWGRLQLLIDNIVTRPALDTALRAANEHQAQLTAEVQAQIARDLKSNLESAGVVTIPVLEETIRKANDIQLRQINGT